MENNSFDLYGFSYDQNQLTISYHLNNCIVSKSYTICAAGRNIDARLSIKRDTISPSAYEMAAYNSFEPWEKTRAKAPVERTGFIFNLDDIKNSEQKIIQGNDPRIDKFLEAQETAEVFLKNGTTTRTRFEAAKEIAHCKSRQKYGY